MENNFGKEVCINEKNRLYKGLKICIFFLVLLFLIMIASRVTERKDSNVKYSDFMDLSEQIDVLFLGSSHMLNGINPLQLYAEYGITSYNMAKNGGLITEAYWTMINALDYCNPKCIVIDLWGLERDYQYIDVDDEKDRIVTSDKALSFLHDNFDYWPLTKSKIDAVNDLVLDYENKKEFLWEFVVYHDRWSSLKEEDFKMVIENNDGRDSNLGANPIYSVNPKLGKYQTEKSESVISDETIALQYLYKILNECSARDIEVVFTFLPMAFSDERDWKAMNTAGIIAEEENIAFLNLLPHESQNVVNFKTDFFDETHANTNGMRKITSYVGKYLSEMEGIVDHRTETEFQEWGNIITKWQEKEIHRVLEEKNLYLELGLIQNLNANAMIFMKGNSQALQDPIVQEFIMQLSGSTNVLEAAKCGGPYLMFRDATSGTMEVKEFVGELQVDSFSSIWGDTCYIAMKDFSAIYIDGDLEHNYLDMEKHYTSEVQIAILGQSGEIMSRLFYDPNWDYMMREFE